MRIALVCRDVRPIGGVSGDARLLAQGLASRGADVTVLCEEGLQGGPDGFDVQAYRVLQRSSRVAHALGQLQFGRAVTRAIRLDRTRYDRVVVVGADGWEHDVVRVHAVIRAEQHRWPARGGRDFRIAHARAWAAPLVRPDVAVFRGIQRLQITRGRFSRLLAVTDEVRDDLVREYGVAADRIEVVPCLVDVDSFATATPGEVRSKLGVPRDAPMLLFVGNDFPRKGLDVAIAALAELEDDARLVVAGGGDTAPFDSQARRLGVAARVHFVGSVEQIEPFFAAADLLVLPSREDVWGMVVIEAMAAGLPVITTTTAGVSETLGRAQAGIAIEAPRSGLLADAIRRLLQTPERRAAMARNGAAYADRFRLARQLPLVEAALDIDAPRGARG